MSLTSYRAAPPRVGWVGGLLGAGGVVPPELRWGGSAGPGGDLLSRALRRSTIGAEGFHGRVRDGIGCVTPRCGQQAIEAVPALSRRLRAPLRHNEVMAKGGVAVRCSLLAKSQEPRA